MRKCAETTTSTPLYKQIRVNTLCIDFFSHHKQIEQEHAGRRRVQFTSYLLFVNCDLALSKVDSLLERIPFLINHVLEVMSQMKDEFLMTVDINLCCLCLRNYRSGDRFRPHTLSAAHRGWDYFTLCLSQRVAYSHSWNASSVFRTQIWISRKMCRN